MSQIQAHNASVLAISTDTVESHKGFAEKEKLNFPLLADPDKKMSEAYGVLGPRGYDNRFTFIIGPDGKVAGIDRAVNSQFEKTSEKLVSRHGVMLALLLSDWKAEIGKPVPEFSLPNYDGTTAEVLPPGKKAAVVMFISKNCPVSRSYDDRMKALASDPAYKDVAFMGINSNANETVAEVKNDAEQQKFPFPVAKDANNVIADHFAANATPTVWVIDAKGTAVYKGSIDDNQDVASVKAHYLKDALDAVLAGKEVPKAQTAAFGCGIKRVKKK